MDGLEEKRHKTSCGYTYRCYVSPPSGKDASKPALLMLHGWPDSARLWSLMLPSLNELPHRLLVPDMLGYAGTDKPTDPKSYAWSSLTTDLVEILDAEQIDKVIPLGHDWGSAVAQRFYNFHASRTAALVLFNVAYRPPHPPQPFDLDAINAQTTQMFGYPLQEYWHLFTAPDGPELFEANPDRLWEAMHWDDPQCMRKMFCTPHALREYITNRHLPKLQLKSYADGTAVQRHWMNDVKAGDFRAPQCWYHAMKDGFQDEEDKKAPAGSVTVLVPVLFIGATHDQLCRVEFVEATKAAGLTPDLQVETVEAGHWTPLEKPEETAALVMSFVAQKGL